MSGPSVGVIVLARDEEAAIVRCLESVRRDVEQMVVLDMQSTDATRALAEDHGAIVEDVPIVRRFDGLRQVGLGLLETDWVFQLDADEWAPEVISRLRAEGYLDQDSPLSFPRMNHLGGRWVTRNGWWPNYQVRMFRRGRGHFTDQFHRFLITEGEPVQLPEQPAYAIRHEGHSDASEMIASVARYVPDSAPMSLWDMAALTMRPLGAFLLSRGWKDGSDGFAILLAKLLNALAVRSDHSHGGSASPPSS